MKHNHFKVFISSLSILIISFLITGCSQDHKPDGLTIAISKSGPGESYLNYISWLKIADTTLTTHNMYKLSLDSALTLLSKCDGLVLTGGPDVYPGSYGKEGDTAKAGPIDYRRDTLEFLMIEKALELGMPVVGICRGLQILNISQGGSLIVDIPTDFYSKIFHRCPDKNNCYHRVVVDTNSLLFKTSGAVMGFANTNHHQGIDRLANSFVPVAWSDDSLIEAIEWKDDNNPYLLAVQWHPERLDPGNPLSLPIAMYFLKEAHSYKSEKQHATY